MTAVEYLRLPETFPRTQLIDGEVVLTEASPRHQAIVSWLLVELTLWARGAPGRGKVSISVDTQLDDRNVAAPDIWWCREGNEPSSKGYVGGPVPDLVIEVLSPSTRRFDLGVKRARYESAGVAELWFVDPKNDRVTVLRRLQQGFDDVEELPATAMLSSPMLAGFQAAVSELFDR